MKDTAVRLQFEPQLAFQEAAIRAVTDILTAPGVFRPDPAVGVGRPPGNHGHLDARALLASVRAVQAERRLPLSTSVDPTDLHLSVAMETGTGKTYVYLRTIHALHQALGLSKFIVVVPSVAIREGVLQTLHATTDHFSRLFSGTRIQAFVYDSQRLASVRTFVTSPVLQVMVATVQALHPSANRVFHQTREDLGYARPIDLIRQARPVVVVDEPQSVDGGAGGRGRQALQAMQPLCTLRYSATHVDRHHLVHELGAAEAREQGLVKSLAVASVVDPAAGTRPFVHLLGVQKQGRALRAVVELDSADPDLGVRRVTRTVAEGDSLHAVSGLPAYAGLHVDQLERPRAASGHRMALRSGPERSWLAVGEVRADVDIDALHRQMLRRTIALHLRRRARLHARGIKVLSLIFVDSVARYRGDLGDGGGEGPGPLVELFEAEYRAAVQALGVPAPPAEAVHGAYFARDRRTGRVLDVASGRAKARSAAAHAYSLIMKDKARLLSLDEPLEFIFSHSALREGWDNPNVFQICVLRDISSMRLRRQVIGRGLRLCVGADGRRVEATRAEPGLNELTIIAPERVGVFAAELHEELNTEHRAVHGGSGTVPAPVVRDVDAPDAPASRPPEVDRLLHFWAAIKPRLRFRFPVDADALVAACRAAPGDGLVGPLPPGRRTDPLPPLQASTGLSRRTLVRLLSVPEVRALLPVSSDAAVLAVTRAIRAVYAHWLRSGIWVGWVAQDHCWQATLEPVQAGGTTSPPLPLPVNTVVRLPPAHRIETPFGVLQGSVVRVVSGGLHLWAPPDTEDGTTLA